MWYVPGLRCALTLMQCKVWVVFGLSTSDNHLAWCKDTHHHLQIVNMHDHGCKSLWWINVSHCLWGASLIRTSCCAPMELESKGMGYCQSWGASAEPGKWVWMKLVELSLFSGHNAGFRTGVWTLALTTIYIHDPFLLWPDHGSQIPHSSTYCITYSDTSCWNQDLWNVVDWTPSVRT